MKKRTSKAFNKKIYLLGSDAEGVNYWLEQAEWQCDWYWGFGYIESYTNNKNPNVARDINSHEHADNFMSEWFKWAGDDNRLVNPTFTEKEGWELSELFKQFYLLRETAEYFGRGKSNIADTSIEDYKKPELVKEINEFRMPQIFERVYEILTP